MVAAIFYGPTVFSFDNYSWISILVNVPATIFATAYYEFLMRDSIQRIGAGHAVHEEGDEGLVRHFTNVSSMSLARPCLHAAGFYTVVLLVQTSSLSL